MADKGNEFCNSIYSGKSDFSPMLLKVEVSSDMADPGDVLWVTSWWQNAGDKPAAAHLTGFMEMEYGHQRIVETRDKYHRIQWEPYPGLHCWRKGERWATTCRWNVSEIWGGTYHLYLGFCDENHIPVSICEADGRCSTRIHIGEIEVGWGWGRPEVARQRKEWAVTFNGPIPRSDENSLFSKETLEIGDHVKAVLEKDCPVLLKLGTENGWFDSAGALPEIVFRKYESDNLVYSYEPAIKVQYGVIKKANCEVVYSAQAYYHDRKIAEWDMAISIEDSRLTVGIPRLLEFEDFEFLECRLPSLVASSSPDTNIVDIYGGGRLISVSKSRPAGYEHLYDVRGVAALYHSNALAIVESEGLDNKIYVKVEQSDQEKKAVLGVSLVSKIKAVGEVRSIAVMNTPKITIDLIDKSTGAPSWQTAAKFWRRGVNGKNRDLYRRALLYKYVVAYGPQPEIGQINENSPFSVSRLAITHTFNEAYDTVRRVCNLIDGGTQIVYMVGWQYEGHDTGYPYVYKIDPRVGTPEELKDCIRNGRKHNAVISLHDNYDDAYPSPYFDSEIIARDERGKPYKGWIWTGGLSHLISFPKYLESGKLRQRIGKTVEMYGIHTSYHIDVLSSEQRRYDFDPGNPAAADQSLPGKRKVVEEFNQYGIDVTSETLSHPFVGTIGYAWSTRDNNKNETLFTGESYIPLTAMIYHGIIQYNGGDLSLEGILDGIIRGAYVSWGDIECIDSKLIRGYYLQNLPMGLFYDKVMENYEESDDVIHISYGEGSWIRVDRKNPSYEIVLNHQRIGWDWSTFAPGFKEGSYLAYSAYEKEICYPLPEEWSEDAVLHAITLTEDGVGSEIPCCIRDGSVYMSLPAEKPIRISCENKEDK